MKKIIDELINNSIEGVDVYRYNDATWLIFTDENRWVVEMTDGGTLWYNYKFFNDIMRYVSMDPKEYEGYITEWANDYFFKEIKKSQMGIPIDGEFAVDIVINDGVKKMGDSNSIRIQNRGQNLTWRIVKDAKPNVVFHGINNSSMSFVTCNGNSTHIHKIVEEGIKNTMPSKATSKRGIHYDDLMCSGNTTDVSLIVEQGIKNTYPDMNPNDYDWSDEFKAKKVVSDGQKV